MNKPTLCGKNRITIPESGCSDCDQLEYQIQQLREEIENWIEQFEENGYNALTNKPTINGVTVEGDKTSEEYLITAIPASVIVDNTPMVCYEPACADSRACYGEACCMVVACNESDSSMVCDGAVCYAVVECEEEEPCEDFGEPVWSGTGVAQTAPIAGSSEAGTTEISIAVEQIAYPLDSEYYPLMRVFAAPYSEGDCPIDEATINEQDENLSRWTIYAENGTITRADITSNIVYIMALDGNDYTVGDSYEVRIYASDELVPQIAEQ